MLHFGRSVHHLAKVAVLSAAMTVFSVCAFGLSDQYETGPEQDPAVLLGDREYGPGYAVLGPVRSDGFLRLYSVQTEAGIERIAGDGLLDVRLAELRAITLLRQLADETGLVDTLKEAASKPVELIDGAIDQPVETARNTVSGVGQMFSRLRKGVGAAVTGQSVSPAELAGAISGHAQARRELALELGVDPHTTDQELADLLDALAGVDLPVGSDPGTKDLRAGGFELPDDFHALLVESNEQELAVRTEKVLTSYGMDRETIAVLLRNEHYTPTERMALAMRLDAMASVDGLENLVLHGSRADSRDIAYFELRRAVLLETYHRRVSALGSIRDVNGVLIALRRDGLAAVVLPLDMFAWNEAAGRTFSSIFEGLASLPFPPVGTDFLMTGDITPVSAERLASFGWEITSNFPMPEDSLIY